MTKTFEAKIMLGLREGYTNIFHVPEEAQAVVHQFVNTEGLCVTFTPTTFVYTRTPETPHGHDPGVIIGLIQYPRFPKDEAVIKDQAIRLAQMLKDHFSQKRVSIVFTDETVMV